MDTYTDPSNIQIRLYSLVPGRAVGCALGTVKYLPTHIAHTLSLREARRWPQVSMSL